MSVYDEGIPRVAMKFAEAIGALLLDGNGLADTSLIQSGPLRFPEVVAHFEGILCGCITHKILRVSGSSKTGQNLSV